MSTSLFDKKITYTPYKSFLSNPLTLLISLAPLAYFNEKLMKGCIVSGLLGLAIDVVDGNSSIFASRSFYKRKYLFKASKGK